MDLFKKFRNKEGDSNDDLEGARKLIEVKDRIVEFVKIGEKNNKAIKGCSTLFMTGCDKGGMKPTFTVVGSRKELIQMISFLALEDEEFGACMVTAMEAAVYKSKKLAKLQGLLKSQGKLTSNLLDSDDDDNDDEDEDGSDQDINSILKSGLNGNNLSKMTDDDIINLAKKIVNRGSNDSK